MGLGRFAYDVDRHLWRLHEELNSGTYRHGGYTTYVVTDNKRREISVASIRDRVVHRLLYEYLVNVYDRIFLFDAWSCRRGKGLVGAIERAQRHISRYPHGWIWRADVKKFFDMVDHATLLGLLCRRITDPWALSLLNEIIYSYSSYTRERARERE